jgi:hypothetical protein
MSFLQSRLLAELPYARRGVPLTVDRVRDHRKDVVDLRTEERQGDKGNDDDERHDQGVLGEALTTFVAALHDARDRTSGTA